MCAYRRSATPRVCFALTLFGRHSLAAIAARTGTARLAGCGTRHVGVLMGMATHPPSGVLGASAFATGVAGWSSFVRSDDFGEQPTCRSQPLPRVSVDPRHLFSNRHEQRHVASHSGGKQPPAAGCACWMRCGTNVRHDDLAPFSQVLMSVLSVVRDPGYATSNRETRQHREVRGRSVSIARW